MSNAAITNDSTPTLDWADVSGANKYHIQVSLYPDFSVLEDDDNTLAASTYTCGALSTDNRKYYWRWRSSADGGTTWGAWSTRYSFWYYSSFSATKTPTTWMFVAPTPTTLADFYTFAIFPEYRIDEQNLMRAQRRNLAGDLIIEHNLQPKAMITLMHEGAFINEAQRNEILRFYHMRSTFFLITAINNGTEAVENVWKCQFAEPPVFNQLAAGRTDYFRTTLVLEEA